MVDRDGETYGSGFFIAPGRVVTAAHVIARFGGDQVFIRRDDREPQPAAVMWLEPRENTANESIYPLPDLAVLRVDAPENESHVCVLLSDHECSGGPMLAQGFTEGVTSQQSAPDPVRVEYEGVREHLGGDLIKCKGAIVDPGMSGGPLLDLATGTVVGVVKAQRSTDLPHGLYAVSVNALRLHQPDMWTSNQLFHRADKTWRLAVRPELTVRNVGAATRDLLGVTLEMVDSRARHLPPMVDRAAIHQSTWVRYVSRAVASDGNEVGSRAQGWRTVGERFRWDPRRAENLTTVIRGLPGYGKSWLLAHHAETIAHDARRAIDDGADPEQQGIPLILDASALGTRLDQDPDRRGVAEALTKAVRLEKLPVDAAADCAALIRQAFEIGRLVVCLDGLDEVPRQLRRGLQRALSILAASANTVLVSTRPSALPLLDEIVPDGRIDVEVVGFSSREASAFIAAWLQRQPDRRKSLEDALHESATLRQIATVPLLLSFLCRLAGTMSRTERFPTSRTTLYQQVMSRLLSGRWREASRSAIDVDGPPDPDRRMRLLSDSMGALQDTWRSSGVTMARGELTAQLRRHPEYENVLPSSIARWDAWQRVNHAEPTKPPPDPVLWEFTFDGLLIEDDTDSFEPLVRVLHPSLRDYLLAGYVARLTDAGVAEALERHRWFDVEWQEIFALATPLMSEADFLIEAILAAEHDPWSSQLIFAAQCLGEGRGAVSRDVSRRVIDRLLEDEPRSSDRRRRNAAFGALIRASVAGAAERGLEICAAEDVRGSDRYHEVVCALAEAGNEAGIELGIHALETEVPQRYRRRLIPALAATEQDAALEAVWQVLSTRGKLGDLEAFLATIRPQDGPLMRLGIRLLRTRQFSVTARVMVAATLLECGADAVEAAAHDPTIEWTVRCRLIQLLVNSGVEGLTQEATKLLRDPSVLAEDKSFVAEAMVRKGEFEWLPSARQLLLGSRLSWSRQMALCRAVRDIGDAGVELMLEHVYRGLPLTLTLSQLISLSEARNEHSLQILSAIVADDGLRISMRGTALLALLDIDPTRVDAGVALGIANSSSLSVRDQVRVAVALARAGVEGVSGSIQALLRDSGDEVDWPLASRQLAEAGHVGRATLEEIAGQAEHSWAIRVESMIAIGSIHTPETRDFLAAVEVDEMPDLWRNRLILALTSSGHQRFAERALDLLPAIPGAYEALRRYMLGQNASLDFFERARERIATADVDGAGERIKVDDELLTGLGLSWDSEARRHEVFAWFHEQLEHRVGIRLASLMLPHQLTEFEAYIDDGDDSGAFRWLEEEFPEHAAFIQDEFTHLTEEIRNGDAAPPDVLVPDPHSGAVLGNMIRVLNELRELMEQSATDNWRRFFELLEAKKQLFINDYAVSLLDLAGRLDAQWPLHEAHLFLLLQCRSRDTADLQKLVHDESYLLEMTRWFLDNGDFRGLFLAGSLGSYRFTRSAPCYFYAALGAAGLGLTQFAVSLMRLSGGRAQPGQLSDGRQTVLTVGGRFDWDPEVMEELRQGLQEGFDRERVEGTDDAAPS
ncbi:trypsin-like peptidase domain-containing protein [Actinoplanes sp. CA-030573]|uniref:trypsin-like peptidase domain-containing protein n=1 Tax=Actinoplanes sp. CA-030573 TaxID=3239898 RepID=UPI003D8EC330